MKIFNKLATLVSGVVLLSACGNEPMGDSTTVIEDVDVVEVGFSLADDATRTTIDADGMTTRWAPGDKLAVWAKDASGNYAFENTTFSMRYYSGEYDKAYFTSNIAPMADGEYTYYLTYPQPTSVEGTLATYSLSDVQSGKYDGRYDIMVAEPVVNEALSASKRMELNTIMRHQMHALKITIPEKSSNFADRVYSLKIIFPNDVVGDITLDVANPNAEPTYSNTSSTITV